MNNLQLGKILNTKPQHPDEYFSGSASPISAWAPMPMGNGAIRLAFAEQVFGDGKLHFRTAVEMPPDVFNKFVESLVQFQRMQLQSTEEKTIKHGN